MSHTHCYFTLSNISNFSVFDFMKVKVDALCRIGILSSILLKRFLKFSPATLLDLHFITWFNHLTLLLY